MTTWRKEIQSAMNPHGDDFSKIVSSTLADTELDVEFYDGYGSSEGAPFTLWTKDRVYFPTVYDGAEWVSSVARNPDGNPTRHVGGE